MRASARREPPDVAEQRAAVSRVNDDRVDLLLVAARLREAAVAADPGDCGPLDELRGVRERRAGQHAQERGEQRGLAEHRAVVTQIARRCDPASRVLYTPRATGPGQSTGHGRFGGSAGRRGAQAGVAAARAERVERLRLGAALQAVGDVLGERRPVLEAVPRAASEQPPRRALRMAVETKRASAVRSTGRPGR